MKRSIREQAQDERDEVVVDMLSILQKIPIQVLGKCYSCVSISLVALIYATYSGEQFFDNREGPICCLESA